LGLDPDASYVAFDFVFALHRVEAHPQLVGISRHISGAYSVLQVDWEATKHLLSGSSQGIDGEPYTLWIYVPNGTAVSQVTASTAGRMIASKQMQEGNSLSVTFTGQNEPVKWEALFTRGTR
jgi:hypothetical protein